MTEKVAIITDTHFGVRGENQVWLDAHEKMLQAFFDDIKQNNIKTIWMLGDIVDSRKSISSRLLKWINEHWTQPIIDNKLTVEMILGNHDTYYRSHNCPNIPSQIFRNVKQIKLYEHEPVTIKGPNNTNVLMVPWITPSKWNETVELLTSTKYDVVCGHFDIQGCLMQGNQICEHGIIPGAFNNHGIVLSGHFHKKSIHNNINYLGNPIATNWGESGDPHGWHFFDGATLDFREFVFPLYKKVYVNHSDKIEYVDDGSRFVKIFVNERNDFYFQQLISQIRQLEHVLQLQIIDDKQETVNAVEFDIEELKDDLLSLMKRTIDNSDYEQPEQMKLLISELYNKAQNSKIIVSG